VTRKLWRAVNEGATSVGARQQEEALRRSTRVHVAAQQPKKREGRGGKKAKVTESILQRKGAGKVGSARVGSAKKRAHTTVVAAKNKKARRQ
jgi:hypothetical protein